MTDHENLIADLRNADNLTADHRILALTDRAASTLEELTKPKQTDYDKLVAALRCGEYKPECGASDCPYWSGLGCMDGQLVTDAADAIETLQAEVERLQADVDAAYAH